MSQAQALAHSKRNGVVRTERKGISIVINKFSSLLFSINLI